MASILSEDRFHNEEAAYTWVEERLWPNGPVCFHCKGGERVGKMAGKTTRIGLYKCYACRKPFTVKMGTVFEASHVAMRMWLQAICAAARRGSAPANFSGPSVSASRPLGSWRTASVRR